MRFYRVVQHTVDCHHSREYVAATANGDADRPRLAVKQYIPLDNPDPRPGDVTIIAAHANGFPKVREARQPSFNSVPAVCRGYRTVVSDVPSRDTSLGTVRAAVGRPARAHRAERRAHPLHLDRRHVEPGPVGRLEREDSGQRP